VGHLEGQERLDRQQVDRVTSGRLARLRGRPPARIDLRGRARSSDGQAVAVYSNGEIRICRPGLIAPDVVHAADVGDAVALLVRAPSLTAAEVYAEAFALISPAGGATGPTEVPRGG
jgi:hypothetical protein